MHTLLAIILPAHIRNISSNDQMQSLWCQYLMNESSKIENVAILF